MTAALANLSDVEFEELVADLLRAETGNDHRMFRRAADGGIDVRRLDGAVVEVAQCKHYLNSTFEQLEREAKKEKTKVDALDPAPTRYRFVTSRTLSIGQVRKLAKALSPWITDENDIWDGNEIDRRLVEHDHIMRHHTKLWLASGSALGALLHAATYQRSRALVDAVGEVLPRYVQTARFFQAQKFLADTGTCLIAGEPGIGKTTMAQMLLLDLANQGFEPLQVTADIDEAWSVLDERHPQAFYYDDFLGRSAVGDRLAKNEDQRLVQLIRHAARHPNRVRLILTTREYILREATELYETFRRAGVDAHRFLLRVPDYSPQERARIFYNHIYHSDRLTREQLNRLLRDRAYMRVIRHPRYNPRVIEYITGLSSAVQLPAVATEDYAAFAVDALDHPDEMWAHAFTNELNEHQQALLLVVATMPASVRVIDLRRAFDATVSSQSRAFGMALKTLESTFVSLSRTAGEDLVTFANPSVEDFLARVLGGEPGEVARLIRAAVAVEQLEGLWRLGRRSGDTHRPSPPMAPVLTEHQVAFAEGVLRLWDAPPIQMVSYYVGDKLVASVRGRSKEARLVTAVRARGLGPKAAASLDPRIEEHLDLLVELWADGTSDWNGAVRLLSALSACGLADSAERVATPLKQALLRHASMTYDYDVLDDLRLQRPGLFTLAEWEDVKGAFLGMARGLLDWGLDSEDELDELERVSEALDVPLPEREVEAARRKLEEPEPDEEPDQDRAAAPAVDPTADIDELFSRLRD